MDSKDRYQDVWDRIKGIRYAMLTTTGDDALESRPMTTMQKEFGGTIWFFTSKSAPWAAQVAHHPAVGLTYSEPKDDCYVSLSGDARVEYDRARIESLWSPMAKVYFPGGVDDPDLTLLRVDVHTAEYWDVKESKPVQLFKMAKAAMKGERPDDLGEHATVKL